MNKKDRGEVVLLALLAGISIHPFQNLWDKDDKGCRIKHCLMPGS